MCEKVATLDLSTTLSKMKKETFIYIYISLYVCILRQQKYVILYDNSSVALKAKKTDSHRHNFFLLNVKYVGINLQKWNVITELNE